MMHIVCYVRDGARFVETYWTTTRGVEAMDYSYALMDLTLYGRREACQDSPPGWPQRCSITQSAAGLPEWPPVSEWPGGCPIPQWSRLGAGRSDDLGTDRGEVRPPPGPGRRPPADESRSSAPSTG